MLSKKNTGVSRQNKMIIPEMLYSKTMSLAGILNIDSPFFQGLVNRNHLPESSVSKLIRRVPKAPFRICNYGFQIDFFHLNFRISAITLILI